jgi:hypothetical protein
MIYNNNYRVGISMTCYKRLDYLKKVLLNLEKSLKYTHHNTKDTCLYISADYYDDSILHIINNIDFIETQIIINNPAIGCNLNTKQALLIALEHNDAVIHLEDDTVPCIDFFDFMTEQLKKYHDREDVLSVSGYKKTDDLSNLDLKDHTLQKYYTCWGSAFWKHKFDIIRDNWIPYGDAENRSISWDSYLCNSLFTSPTYDYYQVIPTISRILNIGSENGTWTPSKEFHFAENHSTFTSDDIITHE